MKNKVISSLFVLLFLFAANACKEDEPPLPDNLLQFETSEQGVEDTQEEITVKLTLSRATESASSVVIDLVPDGLTYGTEFTTQPAATSNSITLSLPAGSTEGSFKILKTSGIFLTGDESIAFTLKSVTAPVLLGTTTKLDVKFASIVSSGSNLTLNGLIASELGASAGNTVFIDFSNNQQTAVARASWDLGFYAGSDFRVILNNTTSASARVVDKTDLNAVTEADTVPASAWTVGTFTPADFEVIDDIYGDLTKTIIAEVSATEADNKVYILNRGTGGATPARPWWKIRILRKDSGYTLQYARITETTFKTLDIPKNADLNFVYASLGDATGSTPASVVSVEPSKAAWDIKWGYQLYKTGLGGGVDIPYAFSDLVLINHRGGVEAAQVLTADVAYDAFAEANLAAVELSSDPFVIGSSWRSTSPATGVFGDRFYVVKDPAGNVYKLKFVSSGIGGDGGSRGKPVIEYKLVKKAE